MKRYAYLLAILALAACAQTSTSTIPSTGAAATHASVVPAKKAGPKYAIAIVLPDLRQPDAKSARVKSVRAISVVGKRQYHLIMESPLVAYCSFSKASGFTGCEVLSESSMTLKKATFTLYAAPKAKGCAMAFATYSGAIAVNGPLSLKFKAVKKKC